MTHCIHRYHAPGHYICGIIKAPNGTMTQKCSGCVCPFYYPDDGKYDTLQCAYLLHALFLTELNLLPAPEHTDIRDHPACRRPHNV